MSDPKQPTTWQTVALLAILCATAVAITWLLTR